MMCGCTFLVPMMQRVHNKLSKDHIISGRKSSMTHRVLKSHKSKMDVIYIYIYIWNHENNVPSRLLTQRLCGNSCIWAHDLRFNMLVPTNQRVLNKLSKECNISGHKWSTAYRLLKSLKSKMSILYIQSWKQCAFPAITTRALWQLMHLGILCIVTYYWYQWTKNQRFLNKLSKESNISRHKWFTTTYITLLA